MAQIGSFGNVVFSVSANTVRTFSKMQWNNSASYATHKRHLGVSLKEFVGNDGDTMSFTMYFSTHMGTKPIEELTKLLNMLRTGRAEKLLIGTKAYGRSRWVITKQRISLERFDNTGDLLAAGVTVTIEEYGER